MASLSRPDEIIAEENVPLRLTSLGTSPTLGEERMCPIQDEWSGEESGG
jgi:hypothetical protein